MKTWLRDNEESLAHLPMVFTGKLHQVFQHLASFSQNSINTNKVKLNTTNFNKKHLASAVKIASKFIKKIKEHIDENSIPKEIPTFARSLFTAKPDGSFKMLTTTPAISTTANGNLTETNLNESGKRKAEGDDSSSKEKKKKRAMRRAYKWASSTSRRAPLYPKLTPTRVNYGSSLHGFLFTNQKCAKLHQLCQNSKPHTQWKCMPDEDKTALLKHMDKTGLLRLDKETLKKHKVIIAPKYTHLLGDANGP